MKITSIGDILVAEIRSFNTKRKNLKVKYIPLVNVTLIYNSNSSDSSVCKISCSSVFLDIFDCGV